MAKSSSSWRGPVRVLMLAVGFYYLPWILLLINSFTPLKVCSTKFYARLLDFRRSFMPDSDPMPAREVNYKDLTYEKFYQLTEDISQPLIIRNLIDPKNLEELQDINMWRNNYGNDTVICVDLENEFYKRCTVNELFDYNLKQKRPVYSRTNHHILYNHPELLKKLENNATKWISNEPLYEIFLGFKDGGSPLHAAFGINLFKQIVGSKRWTFIDPKWLAFSNVYIHEDAASLLALPTEGVSYSNAPWLRKVPRYEVVVNPGDAIMNPCMYLHIVENLPGSSPESLVIGSPERHLGVKYGWRTSWFITTHLITKRVVHEMYRRINNLPRSITASDFIPIKDAESALKFDEYIRERAQSLTGEFK